MKLVLDTNIYCDYAEGVPIAVDFLAIHGQDIFLPSIVMGELVYGFMQGSRQQFNERKLQEIIQKLKIGIIDVNQNVSMKYAIIFFRLSRREPKYPSTMFGSPPAVWKSGARW